MPSNAIRLPNVVEQPLKRVYFIVAVQGHKRVNLGQFQCINQADK